APSDESRERSRAWRGERSPRARFLSHRVVGRSVAEGCERRSGVADAEGHDWEVRVRCREATKDLVEPAAVGEGRPEHDEIRPDAGDARVRVAGRGTLDGRGWIPARDRSREPLEPIEVVVDDQDAHGGRPYAGTRVS